MDERTADFARVFGHELRMTRRSRHLSVRGAADQIGIPFNSYARYERGEVIVNVVLFADLCRWMGRDPVQRMSYYIHFIDSARGEPEPVAVNVTADFEGGRDDG